MAAPKLQISVSRLLEQKVKAAAKRQNKSVSELLRPILEDQFGTVSLSKQSDQPDQPTRPTTTG